MTTLTLLREIQQGRRTWEFVQLIEKLIERDYTCSRCGLVVETPERLVEVNWQEEFGLVMHGYFCYDCYCKWEDGNNWE